MGPLAAVDAISLCTGGGGLDLGLELALPDLRVVCVVEIEAFAIGHVVEAMRQGLMAEAPVWPDARTFRGRAWRGLVDFVFGGIPCQPHSLAGNREGEDDERDLWSDARRIIAQVQPSIVLIENVQGMLTAKPGLDPGGSEFGVTYSGWVTTLRADFSRRRKSAPSTSEFESSSSESGETNWPQPNALWPTPRASEAGPDFAKEDRSATGISLPTAANLWPTPQNRDFKGSDQEAVDRGNARPLNEVAVQWQTPKVSAGGYTRDKGRPGQERLTLDGQAQLWGTPSAADSTGSTGGGQTKSLRTDVANWPGTPSVETMASATNPTSATASGDAGSPETPTAVPPPMTTTRESGSTWATPAASDGEKGSPGHGSAREGGVPLTYQATNWSTPRASDGEKGSPNQSFTDGGGIPLPAQVNQWQTPSVAMTEGGQTSRSGPRQDELLLPSQAKALSTLQDPETLTSGEPSSRDGRSLNPLFVEMLMCWPSGMTLLQSTESKDYACSEMALSLWKQRWRSALWSLDWRPETPSQLGLFD